MAETNPLPKGASLPEVQGMVAWSERGLRITRLRLLSDPGHPYWDVSYCLGTTREGRHVAVELPFSTLLKGRPINEQIVEYARKDGVYARETGIFGAISTLI